MTSTKKLAITLPLLVAAGYLSAMWIIGFMVQATIDDNYQKVSSQRPFGKIRDLKYNQGFFRSSIAFLIVPLASAETIHKCKGRDGGFLYQEAPCSGEDQAVSSWKPHNDSDVETEPGAPSSGNKALVIGQGRGGHYYVDGAVNDHFMNFMIDTGASFVTIPRSFATSAGLQCQRMTTVQTGNGVSSACFVTIQKLTFGGFTLRYVDALVAPNISQTLLGMNVLKRFHVEQNNGQIRLSKNY